MHMRVIGCVYAFPASELRVKLCLDNIKDYSPLCPGTSSLNE